MVNSHQYYYFTLQSICNNFYTNWLTKALA